MKIRDTVSPVLRSMNKKVCCSSWNKKRGIILLLLISTSTFFQFSIFYLLLSSLLLSICDEYLPQLPQFCIVIYKQENVWDDKLAGSGIICAPFLLFSFRLLFFLFTLRGLKMYCADPETLASFWHRFGKYREQAVEKEKQWCEAAVASDPLCCLPTWDINHRFWCLRFVDVEILFLVMDS